MSDVDLMDLNEAAARLKVPAGWLAVAARAGIVPSRKLGRYRRFSEADLKAYLDTVREGEAHPPRIQVLTRGSRRRHPVVADAQPSPETS